MRRDLSSGSEIEGRSTATERHPPVGPLSQGNVSVDIDHREDKMEKEK